MILEKQTDRKAKALRAKPNPYFTNESVESILSNPNRLAELKEMMDDGQIVVVKNFALAEEIRRLKTYLSNVANSTFPEFVPIAQGAKNNFRINLDDERAQVRAWFYVWSFYAWNQDVYRLYQRYAPIYHLRNLIAGLPATTFLSRTVEIGCAARLSVQFYPSGNGYFSEHVDPYDQHQLVVPIMSMSKIGEDFKSGGNYVVGESGQRIYSEEFMDPGDILLFNAQCPHGVATIDSGDEVDPLAGRGRWMMLFAVNKVAGNNAIANAQATGITS